MAGADYLMCGECGKRLVYDGKKTIREALNWNPIFCEQCVLKLKKKIETLKKYDKRKH